MITTADYPALTGKLNEIFSESAASQVEAWVGKEIFDIPDTDWKTFDYAVVHGMGSFSRVAEGADLPSAQSQEGDTAAWSQKRYGENIIITKDMRKFDRYDQIEDSVESAVDEAFNRIDQSMAEVLLNGFAGTSYTDVYGDPASNLAVDGVVLFSASHTNPINSRTFRNLIRNSAGTANPALARDAIVKARADARTYKDPNGVNRPTMLDTLIVSAGNEDLAERLLFSKALPGGPDNDINALNGKVKKLIVWAKLDQRNDGTDTSAYWFMADSKKVKKGLKSPFSQRPEMAAGEDITESKNWQYPLDAYYTLGIGYPVGIHGSTGAN